MWTSSMVISPVSGVQRASVSCNTSSTPLQFLLVSVKNNLPRLGSHWAIGLRRKKERLSALRAVYFTSLKGDWGSLSDNAGLYAALGSGRPQKVGAYGDYAQGWYGLDWAEDGQRMQQCWHMAELQIIFIRAEHIQCNTRRVSRNTNVPKYINSQRQH